MYMYGKHKKTQRNRTSFIPRANTVKFLSGNEHAPPVARRSEQARDTGNPRLLQPTAKATYRLMLAGWARTRSSRRRRGDIRMVNECRSVD